MGKSAYLVLEDGTVYQGEAFGAEVTAVGEVVFNTSMTGYQEMLTDPSYAGQIVVPTYPLIGNYGINAEDVESRRIQVAGFVVREECREPSHASSTQTLHDYLASQGIPGLAGVDTRASTRRLRTRGVMMGVLSSQVSPQDALKLLRAHPGYGGVDFVSQVSTKAPYVWEQHGQGQPPKGRIVVMDYGVKYNILRLLSQRGWEALAVPSSTSAEEVLSLKPEGVVLSPGPGDPALLDDVVRNARVLAERLPVLGICLGHQIVGRAFGGGTFKLKFGHRGGNHPVREMATGRVSITAQNHGYAVDADSLPPFLEVSHINLNDGTVEGMRHRELPILTIQYHSEASPGPRDNEEMFDRFLAMVKDATR